MTGMIVRFPERPAPRREKIGTESAIILLLPVIRIERYIDVYPRMRRGKRPRRPAKVTAIPGNFTQPRD